MVAKCPGCGWSPKTGKTRDLNKHMDLTRNRPCLALLQLSRNTQPITNSNLQSQDTMGIEITKKSQRIK